MKKKTKKMVELWQVPLIRSDSCWRLRRYAACCEAGNAEFDRTASYVMADRAFAKARENFPKNS